MPLTTLRGQCAPRNLNQIASGNRFEFKPAESGLCVRCAHHQNS